MKSTKPILDDDNFGRAPRPVTSFFKLLKFVHAMLSIAIFLVAGIWTYLVIVELFLRAGFSLNAMFTTSYDYFVMGNQFSLIFSMVLGIYGSLAWGILLSINFFVKMYRLERITLLIGWIGVILFWAILYSPSFSRIID
ncbi:MAG: hypothetical protein AB8G15_12910 [Saprospiraceae bacterium]